MADVPAKLEQEEITDRPEQEKAVNDTEEDNTSAAAAAEVAILNAEVDGQSDINKNNDGGIIGGGMWELEDINVMERAAAAAEFLGGYDNVSGGGWGDWKHDDGGETWREWEFYTAVSNNYEDNDWVIGDLWVFDDNHQPNVNGGDAAANPNVNDNRHPNVNGGGDAANPNVNDNHHPNVNGGDAAANPRDPQA